MTIGHVTMSAQAATPRFQGTIPPLRPAEITFARSTGTVTVTVSVLDPTGRFVPNLHPPNFVVYENGVRQPTTSVEVEHADVTLSVLFERGGRYQALNKRLNTEVPYLAHPLFDAVQDNDRVGIFAYADRVEMLADFGRPSRETMDPLFARAGGPGFSETNLYDSLIDLLRRTHQIAGRKAVLLISSGLDTFSHATFQDVLGTVRTGDTPVYTVCLAELVQRTLADTDGPLTKVNWNRASQQLKALGQSSGGRTYVQGVVVDVPAIYDDVMEHLRVRYVVRYPSPPGPAGTPRTVRVALVNPENGSPLVIKDANGTTVAANVSLRGTYTP